MEAVLQTSVFQLSVLTKNKQILERDGYEFYCLQNAHARMGTIVEAAVRMSNDYRRDVAQCSFPSTNGYRRFNHTSQEQERASGGSRTHAHDRSEHVLG